jgi:isocitrate dehydrogenase
MGMYNTDESIRHFARLCFDHALNSGISMRLATKQSFLRYYDAQFRHIFQDMSDEYAEDFNQKLIDYEHRNADDLIS